MKIRKIGFVSVVNILLAAFSFVNVETGSSQDVKVSTKSIRSSSGGAGFSTFGVHGYIEYVRGNLPIVISVPHGGHLEPTEVPDREIRTAGHYDVNSQELAREIIRVFRRATGKVPHVIINRLHRDKLDPNREQADGAGNDSLAMNAWQEFHGFIERASDEVKASFGNGLYIDLHGHRHHTQITELGYLLVAGQFNVSDRELNEKVQPTETSIGTLVRGPTKTLAEILRGVKSLGGCMETHGLAAVPSPDNPRPDRKEYFSGGYNLERHSTFSTGVLSGVQVETPGNVRENEERLKEYAEAFGSSIIDFLKEHGIGAY